MSNGQPDSGPPLHAEAKGREVSDNGSRIRVGKSPKTARNEEIAELRESVNWSEAPDWARLLYLELEAVRDQ